MAAKSSASLPLADQHGTPRCSKAARNAAVEAVFALNRDVGIPPHLRDVGVRKEDIPALAQAALDDVCTGGNPREATLEDIVELYHTAW